MFDYWLLFKSTDCFRVTIGSRALVVVLPISAAKLFISIKNLAEASLSDLIMHATYNSYVCGEGGYL